MADWPIKLGEKIAGLVGQPSAKKLPCGGRDPLRSGEHKGALLPPGKKELVVRKDMEGLADTRCARRTVIEQKVHRLRTGTLPTDEVCALRAAGHGSIPVFPNKKLEAV